jgi:paired amphipathic helix protein Sin3a
MAEIQTRAEEQRRQKSGRTAFVPKYQFEYFFTDSDVILDAARLLAIYAEQNNQHNAGDRAKLEVFIKQFIPVFFGLSPDRFEENLGSISRRSPEDDLDDGTPGPGESLSASKGRRTNGKKTDLLRGVLERGRNSKQTRSQKEGSAFTGSKESTPDSASAAVDEEMASDYPNVDDTNADSETNETWMELPAVGAAPNTRPVARNIQNNEPFRRDWYSLYCNSTIYCFFKLFHTLYERLLKVKGDEVDVAEIVKRAQSDKPAFALKMVDKKPEDYFRQVGPDANYYTQVLEMCEDLITGHMDPNLFEETLRRFYMSSGWQLYTLDKLLNGIIKLASTIVSSDSKEKSHDIALLFLKDRVNEETTHQAEINYRKQAEKFIKEGEVYRITYVSLILFNDCVT